MFESIAANIDWEFFAAFCLASLVMTSLFVLSEAIRLLICVRLESIQAHWSAAAFTGMTIPVINGLAVILGFTGNVPDEPGFVNILLLIPWAFICWLLVLNMLGVLGIVKRG